MLRLYSKQTNKKVDVTNMTTENQLPEVWQQRWEKEGFTKPTLIQTRMAELIKEDKSVLGISPTGSGKTLAYLLPALQRVTPGEGNQLLILLPSQELASQVAQVARDWGKDISLNVQTLLGGANIKRQLERLKKRPEVLVGTPGRVLELIKAKKIKAHLITTLVLDEIDDLVKDREYNATKSIIKSVMGETQIIGVSATGEAVIPQLASIFKVEPEIVDVTKEDDTKGIIHHQYIVTPIRKRSEVLRRLAHIEGFRGLVFFNQLSELGAASERLDFLGIRHQTLASDQHQSERKKAIQDFSDGRVSLLLTTDIGARGLDFSDLYYVVQYDMVQDSDTYIHRSGRIGRMGKDGAVISLVNDRELREFKKMLTSIGRSGEEVFASHGQLYIERPESEEVEETEVKEKKVKKEYVPKESKESTRPAPQPKKKKKKNRVNKNKGASWKKD